MMRNEACGVYKITNTVTGDFYIGSSKDVKKRWREHKSPSTWNRNSKYPLYLDMQKYGIDSFEFQILEEVEQEYLKETEQQFIEMLKPTYNNYNAKGLDTKRCKEYRKEYYKEYHKSDKYKEYKKEYYHQNHEAIKEDMKEYYQQNREAIKEYRNQLCSYNGETLTLNALSARFQRAGVEHYTIEAKKYLIVS